MPRAINHSLATPPGSPPPAPGPSIAGGAEGPPAERRGRRDEQSRAEQRLPTSSSHPSMELRALALLAFALAVISLSEGKWAAGPRHCCRSPAGAMVPRKPPLFPLSSQLHRSPGSAPAAAQMRLGNQSDGCAKLEAGGLPFLPLLHPSLAFFKKLAKESSLPNSPQIEVV